jgi:hypothetical protein
MKKGERAAKQAFFTSHNIGGNALVPFRRKRSINLTKRHHLLVVMSLSIHMQGYAIKMKRNLSNLSEK